MSYEAMIQLAKDTIINRYPEEDGSKLSVIYSSGMMEMQRVLLMSLETDRMFVVTIDQLDESVVLKTYVPEK